MASGATRSTSPAVNSAVDDFCPMAHRNGRMFLFVSARNGGCGGADIYVSRLHETRLVGPRRSRLRHQQRGGGRPSLTDTELYFSSTRAGGPGGSDIYVSALDGTSLGAPSLADGLNTVADDNRPNVRRDGLEIFFDSDRSGGIGGLDLWAATRASTSEPWSTPVNLGSDVNSVAANDLRLALVDATALYFGSNRAGSEEQPGPVHHHTVKGTETCNDDEPSRALVGASFIVAISATPAAADHTAGTLDCGSAGTYDVEAASIEPLPQVRSSGSLGPGCSCSKARIRFTGHCRSRRRGGQSSSRQPRRTRCPRSSARSRRAASTSRSRGSSRASDPLRRLLGRARGSVRAPSHLAAGGARCHSSRTSSPSNPSARPDHLTASVVDAVTAVSTASGQLGAEVGRWLAGDPSHLVQLPRRTGCRTAGFAGFARLIVLAAAHLDA